jgi:hypothetical protein
MAANQREFIRRTAELVEKRRDEYATNDEFFKNLTLNISEMTASIHFKFGTKNYYANSSYLQNFSFQSAIERKLWEGIL